MLKLLRIQNIILVEFTEIHFQKGFNVLSGETGSGKSAIMDALSLITGERADSGMIRQGADKGVVEAVFDIESVPSIIPLLSEAGIDHFDGEDLIIRREINATGKTRSFINNQMAHLGLLRNIGSLLVGMSGQHANQRLLSTENHREIVDLFGGLEVVVSQFAQSWERENAIRLELEDLINNERQRARDIESLRIELEELQDANLKEGEEEELFSEYTLLANSEELSQKSHEILQGLQGERNGALSLLSRLQGSFDQLLKIDPKLSETIGSFSNAFVELREVAYALQNYASHIEYNPQRTSEVNDRLSLINRLKRKYGNSLQDILQHKAQMEARLQALENSDEHIERLKSELTSFVAKNDSLCAALSQKRKEAGKKLETAVVKQLRALNMPKADFHISIVNQKRSRHGDDSIEFYLTPNVGERRIPIKDCASGGELSRLMLSLQTLLAGKERLPTLVFDEIDANIGGATASVVGEKLKEIGTKHQILCITHFPQVAIFAEHHFQISKQEKEGRTVTLVNFLEGRLKEKELARMSGKEV